MTATAERVLRDIRSLPANELRTVWQQVNSLVAELDAPPVVQPPESTPEQFRAAIKSLHGCCKGNNSLQRLLDERARERDQEEAELQAYLSRRKGAAHG